MRDTHKLLQLFARQFKRVIRLKQPAVEVFDGVDSKIAASRHHLKQLVKTVLRFFGAVTEVRKDFSKQMVGQQPHIVGKHTEDEPVDEVRHLQVVRGAFVLRPLVTLAQVVGDARKLPRNVLRQVKTGVARPQSFGVDEHIAQHLQRARFRRVNQVIERNLVRDADRVRPVRVNDDPLKVARHQQRRMFERHRILEKLLMRLIEVRPLLLVLPGKKALLPHVGKAAALVRLLQMLFKAIRLPENVRINRLLDAEHLTKLVEVGRVALPLAKLRRLPLRDKRHGLNRRGSRFSPASFDVLRFTRSRFTRPRFDLSRFVPRSFV